MTPDETMQAENQTVSTEAEQLFETFKAAEEETNVKVAKQQDVIAKLQAKIEDTMNCARLGLYLDDGFNVCLAAGDENNYVLSERTPLIQSTVQK